MEICHRHERTARPFGNLGSSAEAESVLTWLTISAAVRALLSGRGYSPDALCEVTDTTASTLFRKLNGSSPWKAREVAAIAEFFDVSVGALYDGLGGIVAGPSRRPGAGTRRSPSPANREGASVSLSQRARPEGLEPPTF